MRVVIDTSVLIDIFVKSRERHEVAKELSKSLKHHGFVVLVPFHAIFELIAAIKNEKQGGRIKFNGQITANMPFKLSALPIDHVFFKKYFNLNLPYLKANDLIYLSLAKGENIPLITEDKRMATAGRGAGVMTYNIKEFLVKHSTPQKSV